MMPLVSSFTIDQAILLTRFLSSPQRPTDTLTYPQLAGFLFALANGPELIQPSEWIPLVFDDQEAQYETEDEANQVLQAMMALYNDCVRERPGGTVSLSPLCDMRLQPMDNLAIDAPLSQWAQGFGMGYDYLAEVWDACTPDELDEDLGALLMALTFFSSRILAEAYYQDGNKTSTFDELATSVMEIFPEAMREYASLGRSIYHARLETGEFDRPPSPQMKIGRNDPCLCGSGKKFKKCCDLTKGRGPEPTFH
ncbi:MAG TPA: UPF0149 family protein [Nitrospira sp.]|nr:UPF0149 family protein [Nitrospira sp.]